MVQYMTKSSKTIVMPPNLRENKMDKYESSAIGAFFVRLFGRGARSVTNDGIAARKGEFIHDPRESSNKTARRSRSGDVTQMHDMPSDAAAGAVMPDFQHDIAYETDYSPYVQQFPDNVIVHWRGPEFEHYPNDKRWYLGALAMIGVIVLYAIFTDSVLMALVFILIAATGYLYFRQPQKVTDFAITYDGIVVGRNIYPFEDMESFWIIYDPPHTRVISIRVKGYFRPYLRVPLHQVDPVIVLKELSRFIPEVRQEQGWIDVFERLLRR